MSTLTDNNAVVICNLSEINRIFPARLGFISEQYKIESNHRCSPFLFLASLPNMSGEQKTWNEFNISVE